ncbi:MAG TPA: NADPH:quinone oxidoreductase family protein [Burkholderiales bacterium]|nr:NADPH:quinone oxidoreductase family protein [Burkholderiales bacterium]
MRALLCKAFGPPESLTVEEIANLPQPGKGEVKLAVHAAGLNFPDTLMVAGKYQVKPPLPFSPGMECAGIIAEVGEGVSEVNPGDRVMAMTGYGAMAEEVITSATRVFRIPDSMNFEQAAGFPVTYGTTYYALVDRARLKSGEVLLVHGAAGGVGSNAVEIGKILGATVIATAGSDEKLQVAKRYGADHAVNYSTGSIRDRIKALTDNRGVDVAFDPVGGDVFDETLRSMAPHGRLLVIGFASGRIPAAPANLVLLKNCDVVGVYWEGFMLRDPRKNRENFDTMLRWFEAGKLRPPVSSTFPLDQIAQAMHTLLSRRSTGKLIITIRR